ncbi:trypsin-like peptidase domain-containing protein [Mycobacterium sp. 236(2023)]|uniref:trypsin-like serine peptidase n=1 Tax=Mycobacterium sp. 236(2023) TaxID=3038163 RepID=UPI0024157FE1|nr:trypsin-like peptidase domain-containing protein [Mycobacterium sp. 236(2023)]MDG4665084.1 trypsin-like peptidase domain-containing protein [Mycobacterium sp. 236(2023)]
MRPSAAALLVALAPLLACTAQQPVQTAAPVEALPVVRPVPPDPRVGAVFLGAGDQHMCTAAVLSSPSANLILTAAHCLAAGVDARFVPGFGDDAGDAGTWQVEEVYLDPRWVDEQDPMADFAVARVARPDGVRLESVAGDGLQVGPAPGAGEEVTVIGYPAGVGGGPGACRAPAAAAHQGFPALHCDGVVGGFSGAPWISGSTVSGLIGGLDGGGCADEISYSPPFGPQLADVIARAQTGGEADVPPELLGDGCR